MSAFASEEFKDKITNLNGLLTTPVDAELLESLFQSYKDAIETNSLLVYATRSKHLGVARVVNLEVLSEHELLEPMAFLTTLITNTEELKSEEEGNKSESRPDARGGDKDSEDENPEEMGIFERMAFISSQMEHLVRTVPWQPEKADELLECNFVL